MEMVLCNDDLLVQIFVRLPAKSIIQFKSVCKKWSFLISSNHFCHQHALRCPKLQPSLILQIDMCKKKRIRKVEQKRTLLFYLNPTIKGESVMKPYDPAVAEYKILDACNGLWLLESVNGQSSHFAYYGPGHKKDSIYVYNPTTRQSRDIGLPYRAEYPYLAEINLAFDPSKSPYYKIVCLRSTTKDLSGGSYMYQIDVYDSDIKTWNIRVGGLEYTGIAYGVYWNNAIYWNADEFDARCYFCFDICSNEMKTLSFPEIYGAYRNCVAEHQESNGNLYHIDAHMEEDDESEIVQVWKLNKRSKWITKHHNSLIDWGKFGEYEIVRFIGESDEDGTSTLLIHQDKKIKSYSFRIEGGEDQIDDEGGLDHIDDEGVEDFIDEEGSLDHIDDEGVEDLIDEGGEEDLIDDEGGEEDLIDDEGGEYLMDDEEGGEDLMDDEEGEDLTDDEEGPEVLIDLMSQSFYERGMEFKVIGFIFGETLALV